VSEKANLLVTQDFFADLIAPYAVKRGEVSSPRAFATSYTNSFIQIVPVNVSVFNTVEKGLPMQVRILPTKNYTVQDNNRVKRSLFS